MKRTTIFLIVLLILGLLYSFFRAFTGSGGSGLYDFFDALALTSVVLFISSLVILVINYRKIKRHFDTLLFLLIGLPLTFMAVNGTVESIHYNRKPDLAAKYPRPISYDQYFRESLNIKMQIDSLIAIKNRNYGGADIQYTVIDTIIYSQSGGQVFVSYAAKYGTNNLGNDLDAAFLSATNRTNDLWNLREGPPNAYIMSGSFHDLKSLKLTVRQFYYNQYLFTDKDSLMKNYFWIKKNKNNL